VSSMNSFIESVENWQQRRSTLEETRKLAAEIGERHFAVAIPVLVQLLNDPDPITRYNAAMSLGFDLKYRPATEKLLALLSEDTDEDVRSVSAGALRNLWASTKNVQIIKALAKAVMADPDEDVRQSAYKAMLILNGVSDEQHVKLLNERAMTIDISWVEAMLKE
jgi:HEAT repeat protein